VFRRFKWKRKTELGCTGPIGMKPDATAMRFDDRQADGQAEA
jgi:hypothetical protein